MSLQSQYFEYRSRNNKTALNDVKAQVYLNNAPKLVNASALTFAEVDNANSKGLYSLVITPAQLTALGVVPGQRNVLTLYVDSASASLPDHTVREIFFNSSDDLATLIGAPANQTVSGDLAAIAAQQATLASAIQALQNAAQTGGAGIVQLTAQIPSTGSAPLKVPVTIRDNTGKPFNPANIVVTVQNAAGVDRGSLVVGAAQQNGGAYQYIPAPAQTGLYNIPLSIPSTAAEEQLIIQVTYVNNGVTYTNFAVIETVEDIDAKNIASSGALAAVAANVTATLAKLNDSAIGLAQIQAQAAAAATNSANGFAQAQSNSVAIANVNSNIGSLGGVGFDPTKNSLVQLTQLINALQTFVSANVVTGGKVV